MKLFDAISIGAAPFTTTRFSILGEGSTSATQSFQIKNSVGTTKLLVNDAGMMELNGGGGLGSTFSVHGHQIIGYVLDVYNSDYNRFFLRAHQDGQGAGTNASLALMFSTGGGTALSLYDIDGKPRIGLGGHYNLDGGLIVSRHNISNVGTDAFFSWTDTYNSMIIDSVKGGLTQPFIEMTGGNGVGATDVGTFKLHTTQNSYVAVSLLGTVGNFGVGMAIPTAKLHIKSIDSLAANFAIKTDDGSTNPLFYVDNSGHAGFGIIPSASYRVNIDATSATFDGLLVTNDFDRAIVGQVITNPGLIAVQGIANTGGTGIGVQGLTSDGQGVYGSATTGTGVYGYASNPSGGAIAGLFECPDGGGGGGSIIKGLGNASAERFRITEEGKFGLGNPNPTETLDIIGVGMSFKGITSGYAGSAKVEKQDGVQTTDDTLTTIVTISTASDEMIIVKGWIGGFADGSTSPAYGTAYGANYFAVFRNTGGTLVQVSTTDLSEKFDFAGSPTTTFEVSGTNILLRVTGVVGVTVNWVATYEYSKVKTNS